MPGKVLGPKDTMMNMIYFLFFKELRVLCHVKEKKEQDSV